MIKTTLVLTCFVAATASFVSLISLSPTQHIRTRSNNHVSCFHKSYYYDNCRRDTVVSDSSSFRTNTARLNAAESLVANKYQDEGDLSTRLQEKIREIDNNNGDSVEKQEDGTALVQSEIETIVQNMEDAYSSNIEKKLDNSDEDKDEDDFSPSSLKRFEPAFGYYNVTYVLSKQKGENPVGGKWTRKNQLAQKILTTRRTMQHILPVNSTTLGKLQIDCSDIDNGENKNKDDTISTIRPVAAEAINVITLDALWSLIRLSIILRGDAVPLTVRDRASSKMKGPLTNLAVKAFFDSPRIVLGRSGRFFNLKLGPKSSVVLDTTYLDDKIRIGKGGTSGTRFIFTRCLANDKEAEEFKKLLLMKPTGKTRLLSILIAAAITGRTLLGSKVVGKAITASMTLLFLAVLLSTGGIEQDQQGNADKK